MKKRKPEPKVCCICGVTSLCTHTVAGAEWVTWEEYKRRNKGFKNGA